MTQYLLGFLLSCSIFFIAWLLYCKHKNPGAVDVAWGLGILFCGLWFIGDQLFSLRTLLISLLLVFWGLRLSLFLWFTRVKPKHIDKRYTELSKNWQISEKLGFLANYLLQAALAFIIALPLSFIQKQTELNLIGYFALGLSLVGILGEWLADYQLFRFKKNQTGLLCDVGLWQYSRHPNYFFEILVWIGFALLAMQESWGFLGLISPILLTLIMVFITGRITEEVAIQTKGDIYREYQKTTSMIVPWFKQLPYPTE